MRILFVTNYYPPSDYGWGYMQLCEEVTDGLSARGHDVAVLTSTRRDGPEPPRPYPVHRLLTIDPNWNNGRSAAWDFFVGRRQREREAVRHLRRLVEEFRPDVIFVWHYIGLSRVMLKEAEDLPDVEVAYYLAGYHPELPDEYMAYWQRPPVHPVAKVLKRPLAHLALGQLRREGKPIELEYENVICVSRYVRDRLVSQDLIPSSAVVIHNGIDLEQFSVDGYRREFSDSVSLLYAGRLEPDKGVHHILEALGLLTAECRSRIERLAIVGEGKEGYISRLTNLTENLALNHLVDFESPVPRHQMPDLLKRFEVLILPSSLEALSRMMQEGMAMGLLVIGTTTGGSGELLVHERTGLVFEADNPKSLAAQFRRALDNPGLAEELAQAGQGQVKKHFNIERTVEEIEAYLYALAGEQV
jgi:glycosyltransferase involved in cell wall biosynthesis